MHPTFQIGKRIGAIESNFAHHHHRWQYALPTSDEIILAIRVIGKPLHEARSSVELETDQVILAVSRVQRKDSPAGGLFLARTLSDIVDIVRYLRGREDAQRMIVEIGTPTPPLGNEVCKRKDPVLGSANSFGVESGHEDVKLQTLYPVFATTVDDVRTVSRYVLCAEHPFRGSYLKLRARVLLGEVPRQYPVLACLLRLRPAEEFVHAEPELPFRLKRASIGTHPHGRFPEFIKLHLNGSFQGSPGSGKLSSAPPLILR